MESSKLIRVTKTGKLLKQLVVFSLVSVMMLAMMPSLSFAATVDWAKDYKAILEGVGYKSASWNAELVESGVESVAFQDLNGDKVPELIFTKIETTGPIRFSVFSYANGRSNRIIYIEALEHNVSTPNYEAYLTNDSTLIVRGGNGGEDTLWSRYYIYINGSDYKLPRIMEFSHTLPIYDDESFSYNGTKVSQEMFESEQNSIYSDHGGAKYLLVADSYFPDSELREGATDISMSYKAAIDYLDNYRELQPPQNMARPTSTLFMLNNAEVALPAYSISSNNYVKLRDVAALLGDRFDVRFEDGKVKLYNHAKYTSIGGELAVIGTESKAASPSKTDFVWGDTGESVTELTAYLIGGNNYIKLRDIAKLFDFDVDWRDNKAWIEPDVSPYTDD